MKTSTLNACKSAGVGLIILATATAVDAHAENAASLSLIAQAAEAFKCENGKTAEVKHYELSDQSLSFIKLSYDGKTHTLPNVPAASGVRFSDELTMEWHAKADSAVLQNPTDAKAAPIVCNKAK